jgi:hypothetical protein
VADDWGACWEIGAMIYSSREEHVTFERIDGSNKQVGLRSVDGGEILGNRAASASSHINRSTSQLRAHHQPTGWGS